MATMEEVFLKLKEEEDREKEEERLKEEKRRKKEAKRKARIEQRRAKRSINSSKKPEEKLMHDIDKPITLEDLTNPDKN